MASSHGTLGAKHKDCSGTGFKTSTVVLKCWWSVKTGLQQKESRQETPQSRLQYKLIFLLVAFRDWMVAPPFIKLMSLCLKRVGLFSEPCGSQEGTSSMPLPSAITEWLFNSKCLDHSLLTGSEHCQQGTGVGLRDFSTLRHLECCWVNETYVAGIRRAPEEKPWSERETQKRGESLDSVSPWSCTWVWLSL